MTTKHYHQQRHYRAAMRRFSRIQSAWTHSRKRHEYTCKACKAVLSSLKRVWVHRCPPGTVKLPVPVPKTPEGAEEIVEEEEP